MQDLRTLFESEYPEKEKLFEALIKPIFSKAKDTSLTDEQVLSDADKRQIKSFSIIAQVRGGFPIVFADVELQDTVALKRSRVNIQNCVRKVMENDSNAIIFFHFTDNAKEWRVSYVHRAETNRNSTSAKRYTYLCGPEHACRTVSERFETLKGLATIKDEDMIEAFSVEPLSKAFFEKYREQYADLVEYISGKRFVKKGGKFVEEKTRIASGLFKNAFDGDDKAVRDFVKKMMGRLVFLQFLQKKGWLGVKTGDEWGSGDKNFLENLFKNAGKDVQDDFLEQALEELFFSTLNTSRGEEAIAPKKLCDIYGSSIRIPYLNGGLFEEDELDKKKVKFKKEHFASLFEFFNQYNFTIDETDPDDTEIGVDPEMLGKIFENLLEDNKDKGAFYTPKEIVQYMCRESLIAYLSEKISAEENVRNFVLTHEPSFTEKEKADVLNALLDVKVCDPAVGSGAFPMGMLNELLACTQALTGEAKSRAELKKHIVKNNIYGVDIEKGAVDIARLRFWLAIIVDEEEPLPLPNLDYKIMQGNSLLECYEGVDLSMLAEDDGEFPFAADEIKYLVELLKNYFDKHSEKVAIRDSIKAAVIDLVRNRGINVSTLKKLERMNLHENGYFFLWHTWFNDVFSRPQKQGGTKSGFDIVIGNPPYVQLQNDGGKLASLYEKQGLESFAKAGDIYCLFYEKGASLLNETGTLCFITSNKWMRAGYGEKLRSYFAKNVDPKLLVDFAGVKIFENATVDTNILLFRKGKNKGKTQSCTTTTLTKDGLSNLSDFVQQNSSECSFTTNESWVILSLIEQSIKRKIESVGVPLKDWNISINYGIKTGFNDAFIITKEKREEILSNCKTEEERKKTAEIIRPILRGRDIKRYGYDWAGLYLINAHNGVKEKGIARIDIEKKYPSVKAHLDKFWDKISNRTDKGDTPYNLRNCAYMDDFFKPKVMYAEIMCVTKSDVNDYPRFGLVESGIFSNNSVHFFSGKNLNSLVCLLNSEYATWWFFNTVAILDAGGMQMRKIFVENIPLPKLTENITPKNADKEIYKAFNFSNEEISFIRKVIKNKQQEVLNTIK